jgi:hypothetical protein
MELRASEATAGGQIGAKKDSNEFKFLPIYVYGAGED